MQIRNPTFNAVGTIDCEIEHPVYGWIPFTASADDPESHGRAVHAAALALGPAAYVAPSAEQVAANRRVGMVCSRFQARAALMQAGLLDQAEAVIGQADALTRLAWAEAVEYRRTSPAINAMGAALGLTDDQLDDLYAVAMSIEA